MMKKKTVREQFEEAIKDFAEHSKRKEEEEKEKKEGSSNSNTRRIITINGKEYR
jgi:hypothetical protein